MNQFRVRMAFNADEADIRLYTEIGDSFWGDSITAADFVQQLDQLSNVSLINLYVNSPGGDVFDATAMMNALMRHPAQVRVIVDGLMASAATFMLVAADEVLMGVGSELIIHDAWSIAIGDAAEMRAQADVLDKLSQQIAELYARRAGGTADAWRALMLDETWFTAQEAVDAGLADGITESATETPAAAALADFRFRNRAEAPDPMRIVAQLRNPSRPVRAETTPATPALIQKETVVAEATAQKEENKIDGNVIDALQKMQAEIDSKINSVSDKAIQKFIDAMEPVATVAEVKDAVLADLNKKKGPSYGEVLNIIASRVKGSASEAQLASLASVLGSNRQNVFQNAFTYGTGGANLTEQQFIGELVAKVPYAPVIWDLIGHDDLVGPIVYGGAATTLPQGGDYAGDGAVVSSTAPVWASETLTAKLYAIAAGIARLGFDFGDPSAINSFLRYGLSDYYKWRDVKTINAILGSSTGFFGALSAKTAPLPPTNSILQDVVAKIADGIVTTALNGGGMSNFAIVTSADFTAMLEASSQQAPAFWQINLGTLTEGVAEGKLSVRFDATATISAGNVLVGNGLQGITGYELAGAGPVRVEQVVTATGTIDTGLFGYVAPFRENANYFSLVTAVATE